MGSFIFSTLQVIFCSKKQDLKIRKCSDKSTYLRAAKIHLGCGDCSRIRHFFWIFSLLGLVIAMPVQAETLSQAWKIALAENHNLKAVRETVAAAEEQLAAAKAVRLPGLSLKSGYTARNHEPQLKVTLGPAMLDLPVGNRHNFACQAIASIPLYTSGRITSGIDAGTAMLKASEADKASVLLDLKMQVAEAYVLVLRALRGLEVVKSYVLSLEAHEQDVIALYNQGMVARNDRLAVQVSLADARQQMIQTRNSFDLAQAAFNRLLQRPLDQETSLTELTLESINEALSAMTIKALDQRSELIAVTEKIQVLRNQATGVRAENMPQIGLAGGYGYQQNDYLVDEGQWSIALRLQWNLFDGGGSKHRANAISKQANALQEQYNDFASIISLQVRQAWLDTQETQKRLQVTSKTIVRAEENLKVSRNRYSSGLTTNTEVLDAVTLRIKSLHNHANADYDRSLAILHLQRAIGDL